MSRSADRCKRLQSMTGQAGVSTLCKCPQTWASIVHRKWIDSSSAPSIWLVCCGPMCMFTALSRAVKTQMFLRVPRLIINSGCVNQQLVFSYCSSLSVLSVCRWARWQGARFTYNWPQCPLHGVPAGRRRGWSALGASSALRGLRARSKQVCMYVHTTHAAVRWRRVRPRAHWLMEEPLEGRWEGRRGSSPEDMVPGWTAAGRGPGSALSGTVTAWALNVSEWRDTSMSATFSTRICHMQRPHSDIRNNSRSRVHFVHNSRPPHVPLFCMLRHRTPLVPGCPQGTSVIYVYRGRSLYDASALVLDDLENSIRCRHNRVLLKNRPPPVSRSSLTETGLSPAGIRLLKHINCGHAWEHVGNVQTCKPARLCVPAARNECKCGRIIAVWHWRWFVLEWLVWQWRLHCSVILPKCISDQIIHEVYLTDAGGTGEGLFGDVDLILH